MPDDDQAGGRFSHDSALWHTEDQNSRARDIHVRLGLAISVNSIGTALFAVALAAWIREPGAAIQALAIVILIIFALGIAGAFAALWGRLSAPDADPREIHETEQRFGETAARNLAIVAMITAYEANAPIVARREHALRVALVSTAVNAVLAPATIIAALLA